MASRRTPVRPASSPPPKNPVAARESAAPAAGAAAAANAHMALTREGRRQLIAEKAYLRAERRGFAPGHDTEDWLAAEAEVDALLKLSHGGSPQ
ncbi:MAG TPA: DUF2934 domain-containing protein [Steroidobacteraceae bacterium]|nr:DUF2934 domain-containing protein [Steroidobacteraceae bacterium]